MEVSLKTEDLPVCEGCNNQMFFKDDDLCLNCKNKNDEVAQVDEDSIYDNSMDDYHEYIGTFSYTDLLEMSVREFENKIEENEDLYNKDLDKVGKLLVRYKELLDMPDRE